MSLLFSGFLPDPASLARISDSILARLEKSAVKETQTSQWLLSSLSQRLRCINQALSRRSRNESADSDYLRFLEETLKLCEQSLAELNNLTKSSVPVDGAAGEPVRNAKPDAGAGEANAMEVGTQRMRNITQKLLDYTNTLTLALHWFAIECDVSPTIIRQLQSRLDASCKWLYDREILKPIRPVSSSANHGVTFRLEEAEWMTRTSLPPRRTFQLVCPRASLPKADSAEGNLQFVCSCNADHSSSLLYKGSISCHNYMTLRSHVAVFKERLIPVEETGSDSDPTWEMLLLKPNALVTVRLSNLQPTHFAQLESLSSRWAALLLRSAEIDRSSEVLKVSEDTVSVLRVKAYNSTISLNVKTAAVPKLRTQSVKFVSGGTPRTYFNVPWKLGYLQIFQYASVSKELLEASEDSPCTSIFFDEPHFFIFFSERHPMSKTAKTQPLDRFMVQGKSLNVVITDVDCIHEGRATTLQRCSEIHFEFCDNKEATVFLRNIQNMQNRLLEKSLQKPLWGETVVYQHASDILPSGTARLLGAHASLVYNPSAPRAKYRLIGIQNAETWPARIDPSHFVWTIYRADSGRMVVNRQTWEELEDSPRPPTSPRPVHGPGPAISRINEMSSVNWFDELEKVTLVLKAPKNLAEKDTQYNPVKIAVIDTGFDSNPSHKARRQIIKYKDFVIAPRSPDGKGIKDKANMGNPDEPLDPMKDLTGHGTTSVELILKVYRDAALYVARIFKSNQADEEIEPYLMADAIAWASKHHVDIISISAGFKNAPKELYDAVVRAATNNVLIFASAANWSFSSPAAWPARIPQVFAIFSTDAGFKNSRTYNPPSIANAHNFAFLGEDIRSSPEKEPVNGTSASTAIAAGFAARIVDFARQPGCRGAFEDVVQPRSHMGMTAIFKALANMDSEYECIRPLRLLDQARKRNDPDDRAQNRARVLEYLVGIMEGALGAG
ncbi:hypothetical protein PV08_07586 [Exophiala spinifera]|uniref:Peptidase S8/S53 domain-containing protein n=1 Tax=Exophiala spinifera TaxID=91928 RepID=A0A0D1YIN9_9EURO|nr:uncharacterized protein PV08_07586 [Exophiala spinifera]KIW14801.1 hypothetical protein PV08_07586 [Exophiala spinifera]